MTGTPLPGSTEPDTIVDDVLAGRRFPYSRAFALAGFSPVDAECVSLITQAARALEASGAVLSFTARPGGGDGTKFFEESDRGYQELLGITTNPGLTPEFTFAQWTPELNFSYIPGK